LALPWWKGTPRSSLSTEGSWPQPSQALHTIFRLPIYGGRKRVQHRSSSSAHSLDHSAPIHSACFNQAASAGDPGQASRMGGGAKFTIDCRIFAPVRQFRPRYPLSAVARGRSVASTRNFPWRTSLPVPSGRVHSPLFIDRRFGVRTPVSH
jgi:hypothetical protein